MSVEAWMGRWVDRFMDEWEDGKKKKSWMDDG